MTAWRDERHSLFARFPPAPLNFFEGLDPTTPRSTERSTNRSGSASRGPFRRGIRSFPQVTASTVKPTTGMEFDQIRNNLSRKDLEVRPDEMA